MALHGQKSGHEHLSQLKAKKLLLTGLAAPAGTKPEAPPREDSAPRLPRPLPRPRPRVEEIPFP